MNEISITGYVGRDFELRRTAKGTAVGDLLLRVSFQPDAKERPKDYESFFLNATCWGDQAHQASEVGLKGARVTLKGYLKGEVWTDKVTGKKRSGFKISVKEFILDEASNRTPEPKEDQPGSYKPPETPALDPEIPF